MEPHTTLQPLNFCLKVSRLVKKPLNVNDIVAFRIRRMGGRT